MMMATKNWCYGAKSPDVEQAVSDAIFAAHRYRNRLCELELEKRGRHYGLLRDLAPAFVAAEKSVSDCVEKLTAARDAIQAERVKQRTKTPRSIEDLIKTANEAKSELKELRAAMKAAKQDAYTNPQVMAAIQANNEKHKEECSDAKSQSGLYWGTEAIVKQSSRSFGSGSPPRFKRYDGEGQLAVQLQGGLDCDEAGRFNTLCYFGEMIGKKRECFIRIGSNERGLPVFAKVMVVFHRDLPNGKIKWAFLERRKIASHVRWTIRLTIDVVDEKNEHPLPGEVAIHTGWRAETNGLRVATWLGSDGQRGALVLPQSHCDDYAKIDQIRSDRDREFNAMIASLRDWLNDREVPEWLADLRRHLHAWKANARLAALYWQWVDMRFDGDSEILNTLNAWRKKDKHWWQHERRLSVRIVRRRKDIFRNFAKRLSDEYGVAIVSPIDVKDLTENSTPEEVKRDNTAAHRHAKWAAVSDLTTIIREKFPLRCVDVSSVNITRQCANCGVIHSENKRKIQCLGCGETFDADENAVANTLARGDVAMKGGALLALVAAQQLSDSKNAEKLTKMQAANRAARERKKTAIKT
jgi:transposase